MKRYCVVCAATVNGALDPRMVVTFKAAPSGRSLVVADGQSYACSEACERVYSARLAEALRHHQVMWEAFPAKNDHQITFSNPTGE